MIKGTCSSPISLRVYVTSVIVENVVRDFGCLVPTVAVGRLI